MSTLTVTNAQVTNLKDASGGNSSTPAEINSGRAKCWCTFQGSGTAAILDSFNMDSLSDTGTGTYQVNIITDFDSDNYCGQGTVTYSSRGVVSFDAIAAGVMTITTRQADTGTATDYGKVSVMGFGDQ